VHTLFRPSLPPAPTPALFPPTSFASRQNLFIPILQFCWREDIRDNKKDIAFLLVWDKDSYTERFLALLPCTCVLSPELVHLYQTSWLLPGHHHSGLCKFKITILAPVQWAHQTLSSFGFPTFPDSSCMCSPLSVWPKSNNITVFVLDLRSTYEGEHTIFGLLSLANLA
jgi:hypothetical protein